MGIIIHRCAANKNRKNVIATDKRTWKRDSLITGASTIAPMNPKTTLGTLAINSIKGLKRDRQAGLRNSLPKIAAKIAIGAAINME